ncbi:MAG: DUF4421 family protein [Bacteroidales bacterium]|nr:DUF4421 family protein [Bacteroidales bacterium]
MNGIGKILFIFTLICCAPTTVEAQFWHHLDSLLTLRQKRINTDTAFVRLPRQNWIVKVRYDGFGSNLNIHNLMEDNEMMTIKMSSALRTTVGLSASYKGIGLTFSFAPRRLFNKSSDQEYNINFYNNWWGADVTFTNISNFDTDIKIGRIRSRATIESTRLYGMSVNAYYVFNGRKFSYPAAFNNTMIQKRSAGSVIAAATFYNGQLSSKISDTKYNMPNEPSITMGHAAIGGGYAYNYVTKNHWLLHISAQPTFMIWKNYTLRVEKDPTTGETIKNRLPIQNAQLYFLSRVGAIYSRGHYYIGLMSVLQTYRVGNSDEFSIQNTYWKSRIYYGVRF